MKFPKDLRMLTYKQTEKMVEYFVKLPLSQLRDRQDTDNEHIKSWMDQIRIESCPHRRDRLHLSVSNTQVSQLIIAEAINRKEFSDVDK